MSDETDGQLLARLGTDGALWAAEFVTKLRMISERDGVTIEHLVTDGEPGSWLHGWFATAIEAGRGAGYSACRSTHDDEVPA